MTTSSRTGAVLIAALLAACGGQGSDHSNKSLESASTFATATLPSVTVSGVTATSPVLRSTAGVSVSATVTPTFDIGGSTSRTDPTSCNNGNNYCGTDNNTVRTKKVVTTTTVAVSGQSVTGFAADPYNALAPASFGGSSYTGMLPTPSTGTDGLTTVTVSATVSEVLTTCTTIDTSYWTQSGVQVGTTTTAGPSCDNGVTKTGSGSATGSYTLDIDPPVLTLKPNTSQPNVQQGGDKNLHNVLIGGSASTAYTLTDLVKGPCTDNCDGTVDCSTATHFYSADGSGGFNSGKDGIAGDAHDLVGVHIACDAPVGIYQASASANTVDLGGNPFSVINSVDYSDNKGNDSGGGVDTFTVTPGISLLNQTQVVSELPPSGDYAPMACFSARTSGRKVSTFPGSVHLTATVNTIGDCAGFANISGTVVTLTLPAGFTFDKTGASPAAHVFIGEASSGFDFHYPTWPEITVSKSAITGAGTSILSVDVSSIDLGFGAGVVPSSNTIYVRAHAVFTGTTVPTDGTPFDFTTSTTATLPGLGSVTQGETKTVLASSACVNGN